MRAPAERVRDADEDGEARRRPGDADEDGEARRRPEHVRDRSATSLGDGEQDALQARRATAPVGVPSGRVRGGSWVQESVSAYAVMRVCGYARMRLCAYAVMRVCGYARMRLCAYAVMRVRLRSQRLSSGCRSPVAYGFSWPSPRTPMKGSPSPAKV
ncbi:hypothetical protein GCM10017771_59810 [Streptomyces capitiformicae]|uniref:Uncharacterized protein n=1 Tax=Streptomyces capitiformicae TaxID=2014920 RepID=A0A918Z8X4_9ACTN|nr:hypothetical protein GCM10017771_59810 [Streptomyces capitiformicae]